MFSFIPSKLTDACFLYLRKQVQAGADVIQIFDSWANILDAQQFNEFSFNYINSLITALKNDPVTSNIPVIFLLEIQNAMISRSLKPLQTA